MKRQRLVSQRSLARMFQEAAEAWKRQEYPKSIQVLERAAQLDPANVNVLLDLGRAYGMRYDYENAERCLGKAARVSPNRTQTLVDAGRRCQEFGRYEMAEPYFAQAAEQKDAAAGVFVQLAELYERRARLGEAVQLVDRALKLQPEDPAALLASARLSRLVGNVESAASFLRATLA